LVDDKALVRGANHTLTAYLPPTGEAYLYYIKVENSLEQPVYQAYLELSRNHDGTIHDIGSGYTDIFGMYPIYLVGSQQYAINITATGYDIFRGTFITDPNCYGYDCPITFTLGDTEYNETVYTLGDAIHFNATINSAGTINVWYEDYLCNTTNTNITIYEYYNGSLTYNYSDYRNNDCNFSITDTGYNISQVHYIELNLNHTNFDPNHQILYLFLYPIQTDLPSESTLEKRFTDVFGDFDLGWIKTFFVFFPALFFLIVFGANHVGLGILSSGLYIGFSTVMIDFGTAYVALLIAASSIISVIGITIIITKKGSGTI